MSWILLLGIVLALGLAFLATLSRQGELKRMQRSLVQRERASRATSSELLRHPLVDLSRCLGCGTCVTACPEDDVLALVHGQAVVVNGTRCVGHRACERECPVGAITVTVANLAQRDDVPVVSEELESLSAPGVFLAGEVTAHALIATAIEHGVEAVDEVARRLEHAPATQGEYDLAIVGAGPAGLAAALEAKRLGLAFVVLEQEQELGGTVAKYPRKKLVLTQPVALPLHGELGGGRTSFSKEELIALWLGIAREQELPIQAGVAYAGTTPRTDGGQLVHTSAGDIAARHVVLAIGRRGTPRRLGVPGEELAKVAYGLLDAHSFRGRRILVVGGGDSAVETALALAEQEGNEVLLSYRREALFRVRARNLERFEEALEQGRLSVAYRSEVRAIHGDAVDLELDQDGRRQLVRLANDEVFVLAGGTAPLEILSASGVSCDPALRPAPAPIIEQGTGILPALGVGLVLGVVTLLWALWHADYYLLPLEARPAAEKHVFLRPGSGWGLAFGIVATALVGANFLYLARRAGWWSRGSLKGWMTSHVATGVLAVLFATLHGAMDPRDTVGGHTLLALALLLVTGGIGRYFYAWVPRAANGRELALEEVRGRLEDLGASWSTGQQAFVRRVRAAVDELVAARQWNASFLGRVAGLLGGQRALRRTLETLAREGRASGLSSDELTPVLTLARTAYRTATAAGHLEDLRALLSSWRWLHRWVAVLMVVLLVLHVVYSLSYTSILRGGSP